MTEPDYRQQEETENYMWRLALLQRVERGLTTVEDSLYLAKLLGVTTEKLHECA